ncbi:unnamed protein product, partial [Cladocopium goreaui]
MTDGEKVDSGQNYEAVGEQHPNSKDLNMDLATTTDERVLAEKHSFEGSMETEVPSTFVDKHGMKIQAPSHGSFANAPVNMTSDKNLVAPNLAKKLAKNAAMLGLMLLGPVLGLFGQIQDRPDFLEIACSANSSLSHEMASMGYNIKRANYLEGYDLSSSRGTKMLQHEIALHPPRFGWVSLPCTRLTSLVNLTPRSEAEWANFQKRQRQDLKRASEVADGCEPILRDGGDIAWEWPASASTGWKSFAISRLLKLFKKHNRVAYWCRFDGCTYGLKYQNLPVRKGWLILTTCKSLWLSLHHRCPGHQQHCECRGPVAQFSAYYPAKMVTAVVKAIVGHWQAPEEERNISIADDVNNYLLDIKDADVNNEEGNKPMRTSASFCLKFLICIPLQQRYETTDSSSSDEADELIPDGPATKKARNIGTESQYYVLEIPLEEAELDYLSEHPKRGPDQVTKTEFMALTVALVSPTIPALFVCFHHAIFGNSDWHS